VSMETALRIITLLAAAAAIAGCAPAISRDLRLAADPKIGISEVTAKPDSYQETFVLWSGIIVETRTFSSYSVIEVLERPADYQGRPRNVDISEGRFLAKKEGFLDPAVYSRGREVTVAGTVEGVEVSPIGEYDYTYPVINVQEIYLWSVEPERTINYFYYPSYFHYQWRYW